MQWRERTAILGGKKSDFLKILHTDICLLHQIFLRTCLS